MKVLKPILIFLSIILIVLTFLEIIPSAPEYSNNNPWVIKDGQRPLIIPHGGAKLLYPENTVYAFDKIAESGYDVFEIDLCLTADDFLISHHDVDLKNTTGIENQVIRELKYDKIVELIKDSNYYAARNFVNINNVKEFENETNQTILNKFVPAKLEELFIKYPNKMYLLELKDTEENSGPNTFNYAVDKLVDLITNYKMHDKVIVSSFDDKVTNTIKDKSNNTINTSTATNESLKFTILSILKIDFFYRPTDGALFLPIKDDLSPSQRKTLEKIPGFLRNQIATYDKNEDKYYTNLVKQSIINDAHRHNMAVHYWTVNDPEEMRMLINMKVDGIITDRPDLLKQILDEMYN